MWIFPVNVSPLEAMHQRNTPYSAEALALAAAQVADEVDEDMIALASAECDGGGDEDDALMMPVCMPSPDGLILLFDSIFGANGGGTPMRSSIHLVLKVILTFQSTMGFVLICGAVGAWAGRTEFALPADMQLLVATAGDDFGMDRPMAAVAVPMVAGLAKAAALVAFWFASPLIELFATAGLLAMFVIVAYVHHVAAVSVLPPALFALVAFLKLCTAPRAKVADKMA